MLRATDKITALYCRLSVEDTKDEKKNGKEDLSNSIQNQKAMLLQYARDHRFPHPTFFIDDGYSGVTYDRPGFQKMLDEIEAGHVGTGMCILYTSHIFQSFSAAAGRSPFSGSCKKNSFTVGCTTRAAAMIMAAAQCTTINIRGSA